MREAFAEERAAAARRASPRRGRGLADRTAACTSSGARRRSLPRGWQQLAAGAAANAGSDARGARDWVGRVSIAEARARAAARGDWRIAHAPDWPDDERDARSRLAGDDVGAMPPQFVADAALARGLEDRRRRGNVVDGTLAGLVADRAEIGAQPAEAPGGRA